MMSAGFLDLILAWDLIAIGRIRDNSNVVHDGVRIRSMNMKGRAR